MTLSAISKIKIDFQSDLKNTLDDATVAQHTMGGASVYSQTLQTGVSTNKANRAIQLKAQEISSGATTTLDMYDLAAIDVGAGAGRDALGQLITFEEIVGFLLINRSTSVGHLEITPNATNGFTAIGSHTVAAGSALPPDGVLLKFTQHEDAFDVTDAANHKLDLKANGGAVTFDLYLIARHDDDDSSSTSSQSSSSSSSSSLSSSSQSSSQSSSSSSSSP